MHRRCGLAQRTPPRLCAVPVLLRELVTPTPALIWRIPLRHRRTSVLAHA
jgi:hypothetical protein